MNPPTRIEREKRDVAYYDALWSRIGGPNDLVVPPEEECLRQDLGRLLRCTWELAGDLRGRRVLELGCGSGDYSVMLARRGALVWASDISREALRITARRADVNGVGASIVPVRASAEALPFADGSFDGVFGFGVLHHIDVARAAPEIRRLLRPGGRAIFREPLGENPLLEWARAHLPYRDKNRSPNEAPLTYDDIHTLGRHFARTEVREMYLLSMLARAIGSESRWTALWRLDEWLMARIPAARRWCRYAVVRYTA